MRIKFISAHDQAVSLFFLLFIIIFPGCRRSSAEPSVVPPETRPLFREYIGYGVVSVSFTHLLSEPQGVSHGYLRRGTVVRIIERRQLVIQGNAESWVLAEGNYQANVSRGWLLETTVDVYASEAQAITASKAMNL
jgi:hypothetical protein